MKNSKFSKILVMICMLTLLSTMVLVPAATAVTSETPRIVVGETTALPGATTEVPVSIVNGTACDGFTLTLKFDATKMSVANKTDSTPAITAIGYFKTQIDAGRAAFNVNVDNTAGTIQVAVAAAQFAPSDVATQFLLVKFNVKGNVTASVSPLTVDEQSVNAVGPTGEGSVDMDTQDGSVTVQDPEVKILKQALRASVEVTYGTAQSVVESSLPRRVVIQTTDGEYSYANVTWDITGYTLMAAGTEKVFEGVLQLPAGVSQPAGQAIKAALLIKILPTGGSGPGPVPTPKPTSPPVVVVPDDYTHTPYINGYSDGTVKPDAGITRAEVAALLHRIMVNEDKLPDPSIDETKSSFYDVDTSHWAHRSIEVLVNRGILNGYSDGSFNPSAPITRAEYAKVLSVYRQLSTTSGWVTFSDVGADHWAANFISAVGSSGYMVGYGNNEFRPQNNITRAEVVTGMNRVLGRNPVISSIDQLVQQSPYWDITKDHWAYYQILEASIKHQYTIVNGQESWIKVL